MHATRGFQAKCQFPYIRTMAEWTWSAGPSRRVQMNTDGIPSRLFVSRSSDAACHAAMPAQRPTLCVICAERPRSHGSRGACTHFMRSRTAVQWVPHLKRGLPILRQMRLHQLETVFLHRSSHNRYYFLGSPRSRIHNSIYGFPVFFTSTLKRRATSHG